MYQQSEKNLLSSNISSTCPHNMVNFGPLAAEIVSLVWGTPANFNGFCVLAALLHGILVYFMNYLVSFWLSDQWLVFYATLYYCRIQWTAEGSVFWHRQSVVILVSVWNILGTAERICTKFTRKMCLVPRLDEFEGWGDQGQKNGIFSSFFSLLVVYVW